MLKNKSTFSLTSLVVLIVLGFAFAPAVMAHAPADPHTAEELEADPHTHSGPEVVPELSLIDVSAAPGNQLEIYEAIGSTSLPTDSADSLPIADAAAAIDTQMKITTLIAADRINADGSGEGGGIVFFIRLRSGVAYLDEEGADAYLTLVAGVNTNEMLVALHIRDISISYYDRHGVGIPGVVATATLAGGWPRDEDSVIEHQNTAFPDGRNFKVTIDPADIPDGALFATVALEAGRFRHADPADVIAANIGNTGLNWNQAAQFDGNKDGVIGTDLAVDPAVLRLHLVNAEPEDNRPKVVSIIQVVDTVSRADQGAQTQFGAAAVDGPFQVKVTFSEEPHLDMDANNIKIDDLPFNLENADITRIVKGVPSYLAPPPSEGNYAADEAEADVIASRGNVPNPSGRDARYHSYLLTITPSLANTDDVVIRVRTFNDLVIPANSYQPPNNLASAVNRSVLRVKVHPGVTLTKSKDTIFKESDPYKALKPGTHEYVIPTGTVIPANGYLVITSGTVGADSETGIRTDPTENKYKDEDGKKRADGQTDFDFMHNVLPEQTIPYPGDDLDGFFRNGATIKLLYQNAADNPAGGNKKTGYAPADAIIEKGDVIINEIMWGRDESSAKAKSQWIELHNATDEDITIDEKEWVLSFGTTSSYTTEVDSVSNAGATPWDQPGQGGATSITTDIPVTSDIISMSRVTDSTDGTAVASWVASIRPNSGNFLGLRIGTPGGANKYPPMEDMEDMEDETEEMVPVAGATDIAITEIMYSTGRGNLPQWIELTNVSASEVSLEGWEVEIDNDGADDLSITLGATTAEASQAVLLVSKNGRNSGTGDEEGDLRRIVNLKDLGVTGTLLGSTGFQVTLTPPAAAGTSVRTAGDIAGGMDWELEAMDGDRSSLIREMNADATYKDGSMRMSWHLTTGTGRYGTYYGHPSDTGTPGYVMSGPLPVELSMFYPARDKLTGQVVITWETQSELNNAGFYIKRSEAKKGKFVVINPTMIAGAGTTAEKQSYTYTDTTAKPNVLYYYQIEDVSLDGKRATLTGAHRLRGHIGAAGKVTTIWGELKSQE